MIQISKLLTKFSPVEKLSLVSNGFNGDFNHRYSSWGHNLMSHTLEIQKQRNFRIELPKENRMNYLDYIIGNNVSISQGCGRIIFIVKSV